MNTSNVFVCPKLKLYWLNTKSTFLVCHTAEVAGASGFMRRTDERGSARVWLLSAKLLTELDGADAR